MMLLHAVICCSLFKLVPSPYELTRADNKDKVIEVLAKLRNVVSEDVILEAAFIWKEVEEEKTCQSNFLNRFERLHKAGLKNLGITLVVFTMTHMSGVTVITTYVVDIFSSSGISEVVLVLVTGFSEMGFSFFHLFVADKLGRWVSHQVFVAGYTIAGKHFSFCLDLDALCQHLDLLLYFGILRTPQKW